MKNAQVRPTLSLSPLETKVYEMIASGKYKTSAEIAYVIFRNSKRKPKSISNSVTSAVRQINRKLILIGETYRIGGEPNGRSGKILFFERT